MDVLIVFTKMINILLKVLLMLFHSIAIYKYNIMFLMKRFPNEHSFENNKTSSWAIPRLLSYIQFLN